MSKPKQPCPKCGSPSKWHSNGTRKPITLNGVITVTAPRYYCVACNKRFVTEFANIPKNRRYHTDVIDMALHLLVDKRMTLEAAKLHFKNEHGIHVPHSTMHEWVTEHAAQRIKDAS